MEFLLLLVLIPAACISYWIVIHNRNNVPKWRQCYFYLIDNLEFSDVKLMEKLAYKYGLVGYKASFLLSAAKKFDQETFEKLFNEK